MPNSGPIRICVIEPSGLLYGSELALLDILETADRSRLAWEVVLPKSSAFSRRLHAAGIPFYELLEPSAHRVSRLKKALTYVRLYRRWRQHPPSLAYVNQGGILRPVAAIARLLRIPVLCQVQTLEDARWVSRLSTCHGTVSTFVCNSEFIARECRVPQDRLCTVYYGYRPKCLRRDRTSNSLRAGCLEVGLLGRLCESKGHHLAIEAARRMKETSAPRVHFRFIGEASTPAEGDKLRQLVDQHGLQDWIEFRGYRTDLAEEFKSMDLLLIPSVAEPFGRIFCEAAEAKVPVLLADSGGLGELSHRFNLGLRCRPSDPVDLVQKLALVARDYDRICADFATQADRMLNRLSINDYAAVMGRIATEASLGKPVSMCWLGNGL